jgi:KUP system potassium uptake protein
MFALSVMSIGIVFGDIGTSPLYAIRESFSGHFGVTPTPDNVLGILSLVTWALVIIVSIKYVQFLTRVDNGGEGGVLALTALVEAKGDEEEASGRKRKRSRSVFVFIGLFGAALLFGDAILTPAISVMGGVEGLTVATPSLAPFVVPISVAVLAGLFLVQRRGTSGVGKVFGPVMLVWFIVIALLGLRGIAMAPQILLALNPMYGLVFLVRNGTLGVLALGAVFLAVTGAEALYADLGHFGRAPIRAMWFALAFPCLMMNYYGQGALVLSNPAAVQAPFFLLAPEGWALPLTALATVAAIIASQAVITGMYSLALQVTQLGYWPRINIRHTSATEFGQIYVPPVNAVLAVSTIAVVIAFGSSSALAAAYGVAIVSTMVVTTLLLFHVAPSRLGWSRGHTWLYLGGFLLVEGTFLVANVLKIHEGGWLPLVIAVGLLTAALSWRHGRDYLAARIVPGLEPIADFISGLSKRAVVRVPGAAVFMTRDNRVTPTAMLRAVEHLKALHEQVVLLTIKIERLPRVRTSQRVVVEPLAQGFVRVTARYGYMEQPNIPTMLERAKEFGVTLDLKHTTYFLGRERLLTGSRPFFARAWVALYSFLDRNSQRAWAFYRIPHDRVVEIGSQYEV